MHLRFHHIFVFARGIYAVFNGCAYIVKSLLVLHESNVFVAYFHFEGNRINACRPRREYYYGNSRNGDNNGKHGFENTEQYESRNLKNVADNKAGAVKKACVLQVRVSYGYRKCGIFRKRLFNEIFR